MSNLMSEGFYVDRYGNLQPDRRKAPDRRKRAGEDFSAQERRRNFRRQVDREVYDRDHRVAIKEALEDFAEEHGGHL